MNQYENYILMLGWDYQFLKIITYDEVSKILNMLY